MIARITNRLVPGFVAIGLLSLGCAPSDTLPTYEPVNGITVRMDFDRTDLYDAPWPSDDLMTADGVDLSLLDPNGVPFVVATKDLLHHVAAGFGTTSTVYLPLTGAVAGLPTVVESLTEASPIQWLDVDTTSPDFGRRVPFDAAYLADSGPWGAPDVLALLPVQGVPLAPGRRYAVLITRDLTDADGAELGRGATMTDLLNGEPGPDGYSEVVALLPDLGIDPDTVAGMTVFSTWSPADTLLTFIDATEPPVIEDAVTFVELFDDYCVFSATVDMPVHQQGEPPYLASGGAWPASPLMDHFETARVVITIPREPEPDAGYPTLVMSRTGGGGDRPLVDRGVQPAPGEPALIPGSGPAMEIAQVGFAGVQVDGPHGGIRNVSGGDEQFLIFNVANPSAMRDNVRQSALELALLPDVLTGVEIPLDDCPGTGGGVATLHTDRLALMGHSMGATIVPGVVAAEPRYEVLVLSGAGGSWIHNVVYKQSPLQVRPLAEAMIGYLEAGIELHDHDPVLALLQWAGESADPPVYGRGVQDNGTHILMHQGIVDTYILPPIANAMTLSMGMDAAGLALDADHPDLVAFATLDERLALVPGQRLDLPLQGTGEAVRVNVQHPQDALQDGHEVMFQTAAPKAQYRCFLQTWWLDGVPTVPTADGC